ncbi:MAG: hypothetical protein RLZZ417_1095 [Bacteroidota bacterium]|jgi:hypothetical protein
MKINFLVRISTLCFLFNILSLQAQNQQLSDGLPGRFDQNKRNAPRTVSTQPAFRSIDGTNNNIARTKAEWGATNIALVREIPAEYGATDTKNAMGGTGRPSARQISNAICDEPVTTFSSKNLSTYVYVWGQFLDHDIVLTPSSTTESVPIALPANETLFTVPISFSRSTIFPGSGINTPRQQMNLNTAWIDGSVVYGSDSVRASWLRTKVNGKLKTSAGNNLPWNTVNGESTGALDASAPSMANDGNHTIKTIVTGDVRGAEHPGITGLHLIFVREHNRICDRLRTQGLTNDEEIYQKARKEIGALIQAITYQEFLPAMGVTLSNYSKYNGAVQPDILNSFATAGYRIGHTQVADLLAMRDNNCAVVGGGGVDLIDAFFNLSLMDEFGLESFLKGFATHKQYETDTKINSILRNFLFGSPTAPVRFGLDLAALNIQRGRDHGLPDYNDIRKFYTGTPARTFADITKNTTLAAALQTQYGTIDNIDLWIGILAEDLLPGKSVGKTMHAMLKAQFEKLRDGDFYFYKSDPNLPAAIKTQVSNTKLSDVIKRNTTLTNLQSNVFITNPCPGETGEDVNETPLVAVVENYIQSPVKAKEGVNIYPNPVNDLLNIQLESIEGQTLRLTDQYGRVLRTMQTKSGAGYYEMSVSDLPVGVYYLQVSRDHKWDVFKVIKMNE